MTIRRGLILVALLGGCGGTPGVCPSTGTAHYRATAKRYMASRFYSYTVNETMDVAVTLNTDGSADLLAEFHQDQLERVACPTSLTATGSVRLHVADQSEVVACTSDPSTGDWSMSFAWPPDFEVMAQATSAAAPTCTPMQGSPTTTTWRALDKFDLRSLPVQASGSSGTGCVPRDGRSTSAAPEVEFEASWQFE